MKTIITATIAIVVLVASLGATQMIDAQSAYAETAYQSGFKHGMSDAKIDTTNSSIPLYYIHHTTEFVHGWCSIMGSGSGIEANDDPEPTLASFDCDQGLSSAFPHPNDWPN